ncbi:hypothetical protein [Brevundimonas sp. Root1423]|uniref:hypothetical protein n=1 Tax=Brevundimonas sp. Root1423 TaxID=1736462 RepID=UPI0006F581CD|nr:hypothetical protein [Brevundimonas sp. Root1423]KQY89813.1 hypothetical protein ASD25_04600 [Brevundimonas sp. Root1423]
MTGGLIVWAVHFLGVYTLSSLADVVVSADAPAWRAAALVFSGVCVLASAVLLALAAKRLRRVDSERPKFADQLAALGAGLALVAIVWQALPTVIGY